MIIGKLIGVMLLATVLTVAFSIIMLLFKILLFINASFTIGGIGTTIILSLLIMFLLVRNNPGDKQ